MTTVIDLTWQTFSRTSACVYPMFMCYYCCSDVIAAHAVHMSSRTLLFYSIGYFYISSCWYLEMWLVNFNYWELCFLLEACMLVTVYWPRVVKEIEVVCMYWVLNVCQTVLSLLHGLSHLFMRATQWAKCCFYHHFTGEGGWDMEREGNLSTVTQLISDAKIWSQVVQCQSLRFLGSLEHLWFLGL